MFARRYDVIERIPPIDSRSDEGRRIDPADLKGHIELRNIVFRYPSRPTVPVLKDLCLTFPAGQVSALVGASGCGKTSIVGLIERFYDPIAGQVLLDGVPLKDLNVRWLRSQIGLVSQEPTLFSASVEEKCVVAYPRMWPH
jgi:ATP-binding cassette subfamily B (MDR/TAP) protein 1